MIMKKCHFLKIGLFQGCFMRRIRNIEIIRSINIDIFTICLLIDFSRFWHHLCTHSWSVFLVKLYINFSGIREDLKSNNEIVGGEKSRMFKI